MSDHYDIAIIGAGVAGAFAAYNLLDSKAKICLIDFGRPPSKRRKQLEGWLGCFPNSNARIYKNSCEIKSKCGTRITNITSSMVDELLFGDELPTFAKNKAPTESAKAKALKNGYSLVMNNYIQWKPEQVHNLSKIISDELLQSKIELMFDTEVTNITKNNDIFKIETEHGSITANKIIFGAGRSGWRFANKVYKSLNLSIDNDYAYFGFKCESSASVFKEWNESHCSLIKDDVLIGPLSWKGTVIPEDHCDLVVANWRSNEDRWKSERVAFSLIFKEKFENNGFEQTERLGTLAYVLSDCRVGKVKIREFLDGKIELCKVPEYENIMNKMYNLDKLFNDFSNKVYINMPDILTNQNKVNINKNLETDVKGFYAIGESAGFTGIYSAALSGIIASKKAT
jgi:uncharacterized FAD-dependent dehydrogenase